MKRREELAGQRYDQAEILHSQKIRHQKQQHELPQMLKDNKVEQSFASLQYTAQLKQDLEHHAEQQRAMQLEAKRHEELEYKQH